MKCLSGMLLALLLPVLTACMGNPVRNALDAPRAEPPVNLVECEGLDDSARLRLSLVEDELQAGHPRAALAYLDGLPAGIAQQPRAIYLRAEAERSVAAYDRARRLYQSLTADCLSGAAYHGLGLVAARNDLAEALINLQKARTLLPTDPRVRNDYGYALLLAGRLPEARVEFETVLELSARHPKAASNLVLALLIEDDEPAALRYARANGLSGEQMDRLRLRAGTWRSENKENHADADLH